MRIAERQGVPIHHADTAFRRILVIEDLVAEQIPVNGPVVCDLAWKRALQPIDEAVEARCDLWQGPFDPVHVAPQIAEFFLRRPDRRWSGPGVMEAR